MSYLVLARRFRPQSFEEVTSQEHVTKTLQNGITRGKIGHAYLLTGPRGVGKTSIARIFAKCLNCTKGPTPTPCLECVNCQEVASGRSLSVREIDGASHNSVDNVRELIESFRSVPPSGSKYKIYIIDEVHMLSLAAFNALLKSLEEPPPHTVFVLATTDPHKIPETVISRCQRHDLRALTQEEITSRLREVAAFEKLQIEDEAIYAIARVSDGSMRDSQSLLERVQMFCDGVITAREAAKVIGVVDEELLRRVAEAILTHDSNGALVALTDSFKQGADITQLLKEFVGYFRDLLLIKSGGDTLGLALGITPTRAETLHGLAEKTAPQLIENLAVLAREGADEAHRSSYPRYALESLVLRMAHAGVSSPERRMKVVQSDASVGGTSSAVTTMRSVVQPTSSSQPSSVATQPSPQKAAVTPRAASYSSAVTAAEMEEEDAPVAEGTVQEYSWPSFLETQAERLGVMITEQLKRVSAEKFSRGELTVHGPEFSVNYLSQADRQSKLLVALNAYSRQDGTTPWRVNFKVVSATAGAATGSIHQVEQAQTQKVASERTRDLSEHPKVRSLQKVFGGSTIESVRLRGS